jgi:acyl-CoA synthetase (AMP-forming)/AMP-acid ligase II
MMESAAHAVGCTVFPGGVGQTEQQVQTIRDLRPAGYMGTPSFLKIILEKADELGVELGSLKRALVSGEAFPPSLRDWLDARGIEGYQAYGSADLGMIAFETPAREGLVLSEDLLLEIVRPGTNDVVPEGEVGEVVGRSPAMMNGYHNQPGKTAEAEWISPEGLRYIRTGDVGRFDAEGFLTLMDRKKDMIISGGFNIYPSDLESVIVGHPAVLEAAVVGALSDRWGETPVAFVTLKAGATATADEVRDWANAKLGKTQRLAALKLMDVLPRSAIGKVLKRELRDQFMAEETVA